MSLNHLDQVLQEINSILIAKPFRLFAVFISSTKCGGFGVMNQCAESKYLFHHFNAILPKV